jgi:hypothetical protein
VAGHQRCATYLGGGDEKMVQKTDLFEQTFGEHPFHLSDPLGSCFGELFTRLGLDRGAAELELADLLSKG